ncbi:MAG: ATP-dependent RecD-like DNA helicase, partial [Oscillospiraceae bacterium]
MREMLNPATEKNSFPGVFFRDGDRVIILQNDWTQGVCNGDVGRFFLFDFDPVFFAVSCDSGMGGTASGSTSMLGLAYTITVHKSQGSEYDTVILPLSRQFTNMMYRNLLYTAISRAKKRVILVGDADVAEVALQREPPKRRSMLVQKTRMLQERSA